MIRINPLKLWYIVYVPVKERQGGLFPFLFLGDGNLYTTSVKFAHSLSSAGWSDQKIIKSLNAIGKFYTYLTACSHSNEQITKTGYEHLTEFAELRFRGSIDRNGFDEKFLYWERVNYRTVNKELGALSLFSDFCHRYYGDKELNPVVKKLNDNFSNFRDLRLQGLSDPLVHLRGLRKSRNRQFELNPTKISRRISSPKYLPTDTLIELIEDGCKNPRDKMLLLLMGFGGLRISETLHIYVNDVIGNFKSTNATKVILAHPSEGKIRVSENHETTVLKRTEFLMRNFNRLPRNELGIGHLEYAGWKGMSLNEQEIDNDYVFWLEEHITGTYFRKLLEEYLFDNKNLFSSSRQRHPYLFFNIQRNRKNNIYGNPLTYFNAQEIYSAACQRIGLTGFSPHSCRHHYGYYSADRLGIPIEKLQRQLRHRQITSTEIYYHLSHEAVRNELSSLMNKAEPVLTKKPIIFPSSWEYS